MENNLLAHKSDRAFENIQFTQCCLDEEAKGTWCPRIAAVFKAYICCTVVLCPFS